jgi:hypothetical protein
MKRKQVAFSVAETRHILFMDRDYYKIGKNKNEKKWMKNRMKGLEDFLTASLKMI